MIFAMAKNFGDMKIGLGNDLTKEEREERKSDYEILKKYKDDLHHQGKECIIKGMKLTVDDTTMDVDEIKDILKNQDPEEENPESDTESDDSSFSRASSTSRKRGRPPGSKNLIQKRQRRGQKSTEKFSTITPFLRTDVSQVNPDNKNK